MSIHISQQALCNVQVFRHTWAWARRPTSWAWKIGSVKWSGWRSQRAGPGPTDTRLHLKFNISSTQIYPKRHILASIDHWPSDWFHVILVHSIMVGSAMESCVGMRMTVLPW